MFFEFGYRVIGVGFVFGVGWIEDLNGFLERKIKF